ncbi:MAG: hypothetical protein KIS87_05545 [Phycisphaeraceae bacterium]|nr:hypothetical protein [Phycisphaeraceae bacterium]
MLSKSVPAVLALTILCGATHAQVVINEVYENPPGSIDEYWEYIELYGYPGASLDGYLIALLKGGADLNGDGIPDRASEIDECFALDGYSIGSNGLFVLYNDILGFSFIPDLVAPGTTLGTFTHAHVPTIDTPGKLGNDDSSTYVLVRRRPADQPFGTSWRKDIDPDVNWDSRVDFGPPYQTWGKKLEPYQMVDDIAWSNNAGKEYVRSSQDEISDTPGYNPDGISRLAYRATNPGPQPRRADEEWVRGDVVSVPDNLYQAGRVHGPTGVNLTGFGLTPGHFNERGSVTQFRFVTGDINFDGVTNRLDHCLAVSLLGTTLDDEAEYVHDNGTKDDPSDDFVYTGWKWQGRAFNGVHALMHMDVNDGAGFTNADRVTQADVAAILAHICIADWNADGVVNTLDFIGYLNAFTGGDPCADVDGNGIVNTIDVLTFLNAFVGGC